MEKRIEFKQTNSSKLTLVAVVYFVLLIGFVLYATLGNNKIAGFISSLDYTVVGLLGGILLLAPLFVMIPFTSYRVAVSFNNEELRVQAKNRKDVVVKYSSIDKMYLNRKRLCELELVNLYSKPLHTFRAVNDGAAIDKIVSILTKEISFSKTSTQIKKRIGSYPFVTYQR